jgi:hypothetical protein
METFPRSEEGDVDSLIPSRGYLRRTRGPEDQASHASSTTEQSPRASAFRGCGPRGRSQGPGVLHQKT